MRNTTLTYLAPTYARVLALLLLALLTGGAATGTVADPEARARHLTTAATLASAQLERLKTLGYRHLTTGSSLNLADDHTLTAFPGYRQQTSVEADTPERGLTLVTVTVSWDGENNAVQMHLIVAE